MYKSHFAAAVMVDNEIVREVRKDGADVIYLPFGTDYQIRLKNLDFRRAVVSISIDGEDVLDGSQLVLDGNSTTDLKGFLDAKKNLAHNAFRFIEKTEKVSEHRGNRVDDGLLRIEVQFEEALPEIEQIIKWPAHQPYDPWYPWYPGYPHYHQPFWHSSGGALGTSGGTNILRGQSLAWSEGSDAVNNYSINCSITPPEVDAPKEALPPTTNTTNDAGITVSGSVVDQAFTTTVVRKLAAEKTVIVFQLRGKCVDGRPVVVPLLVKSKIECKTCGTISKSGVKFCKECGTCLL